MSTSSILIIVAIAIYLLGMLIIGFVKSKNNSSSEDFYLGGRKMGPLVVAMSAEASDMSSWLLMGLPGVAFLSGVCDAAWTAIGLAIGTYLNWLLVSRRLRRYSHKIDAITIPDFFAKRFHDKKSIIGMAAAAIIIIFFIPYTASGFAACGKLFNALFDVDYTVAMVVSAVVIVGYTIMGGFGAVCITDLIQSFVMTLALVVIVVYGISNAGGFGAVIDNAKDLPGYFSMNNTFDAANNVAKPYGLLTIISTMAWGLGYFGVPHVLVRFMSIEDEKKLVTSRRIAIVWVTISMGIALFIGTIGLALCNNGFMSMLNDPETVIIAISQKISENGVIAALVAGIIMAGILAATMSTADSQMLSAASSFSQDILQNGFKIKMSEKAGLIAARLTVISVAIISVFLARDPNASVFKIVSFAWAGFGGAFGAVVLCALFWKRCNLAGALSGMIAGGITVFAWKYKVRPLGGAWDIYELLPAFIVSLVLIIVVSLITKAPDESIVKEFEAVND